MAISTAQKNEREGTNKPNTNSCSRLHVNFPSKSPSPYHNLPTPKLKIKFLTLHIKKPRKDDHGACTADLTTSDTDDHKKKRQKIKKWCRKGKVLQRKVRAIIWSTLGSNKYISLKATSEDNKVHDNCNEIKKCLEETDEKPETMIGEREDGDEHHKKQSKFVASLPSLARVPSRGLNGLRKIGRVMSMRKDEAESQQAVEELCKKRILMGRKCQPLNRSGALHYDKYGVLVPEAILSPCNITF